MQHNPQDRVQYLQIGKIVNTHGIRGEVKVMPLTDDPERFIKLKWVYIEKNSSLEKIHLESTKFFKSTVIIKFQGIDDMNAAEALKEHFILIDRENAVKLPKDSYFICDIIGLRVYNENGETLGTLSDILKTGSNDVYVVKKEEGKDLLIPALKSVVKEISIEEKKMVVVLPEGLVNNEV